MTDANPDETLDDVDPAIREFVNRINEGYEKLVGDSQPGMVERRAIAEEIRKPWRSGGPEMVETRDFDIAGMRMRLHRPVERTDLPVLLYIHGGGWALFSIDTHDRLMREYAHRAGIAVVGIDYSLAPEAKFPVALDEVVGAVRWLRDHADEIGIDAARMAIGGDSAGANLTVAACLKMRDLGLEPVQAMVLNYGAFAPERMPSYDRFGGPTYCLTIDEMDAFWGDYVAEPEQMTDPLVAPLLGELHDLPPAFLAIAACDILADSNHAMAEKLRKAGVLVEAVEYQRATHSFLEAMSIAPLARKALDDQAKWLRQTLAML